MPCNHILDNKSGWCFTSSVHFIWKLQWIACIGTYSTFSNEPGLEIILHSFVIPLSIFFDSLSLIGKGLEGYAPPIKAYWGWGCHSAAMVINYGYDGYCSDKKWYIKHKIERAIPIYR